MLIRFLVLLSFILLFQTCSEDEKSSKSNSEKIISDTVFQSAPTSKDTLTESSNNIQIHIFQKGETLWDLCKRYYGNRHYSSILSLYNGIDDVNRIDPGTEIKVPSLNELLTNENFGLVPPLEKEVYKILAARQMYVEVEQILWELRKASNFKGKQNLPEAVVINLERAADLIDLTIIQLGQPKENNSSVPDKMINNLKSVSRNLKHLSEGANDGYGYDLDMVHQDLIRAILNGRAWVMQTI